MNTCCGKNMLYSTECELVRVAWCWCGCWLVTCSSVRSATQLQCQQRRCDRRATAVGPASQASPQRPDRTVRAAVPRSTRPGRRVANQHHRDVDRHRRTSARHQLHLPDPRLHRQRTGTLEQPVAISDLRCTTWVVYGCRSKTLSLCIIYCVLRDERKKQRCNNCRLDEDDTVEVRKARKNSSVSSRQCNSAVRQRATAEYVIYGCWSTKCANIISIT